MEKSDAARPLSRCRERDISRVVTHRSGGGDLARCVYLNQLSTGVWRSCYECAASIVRVGCEYAASVLRV